MLFLLTVREREGRERIGRSQCRMPSLLLSFATTSWLASEEPFCFFRDARREIEKRSSIVRFSSGSRHARPTTSVCTSPASGFKEFSIPEPMFPSSFTTTSSKSYQHHGALKADPSRPAEAAHDQNQDVPEVRNRSLNVLRGSENIEREKASSSWPRPPPSDRTDTHNRHFFFFRTTTHPRPWFHISSRLIKEVAYYKREVEENEAKLQQMIDQERGM